MTAEGTSASALAGSARPGTRASGGTPPSPSLAAARTSGQRARRRRIVQAAAALAAQGGVERMQMRKVAELADVALGTLYRYFPSKMDLVVAVVGEELDLLEADLAHRPPRAPTPAGRAVDVLMRATRGLMREPELADALIRSLIASGTRTDVGDRLAGLLLWAAGADAGEVGEAAAARAVHRRRTLVASLGSAWLMELLKLLRGRRTIDELQHHMELTAGRLLGDF